MFEIGGTELLLVAVVALLVIGPKELPRALRTVGQWTGKARAMTRHLRAGFDEMVRQSELEEMEKKWAEQNARIMAETPIVPDYSKPAPAQPAAPSTEGTTDPANTTGTQTEEPSVQVSETAPAEHVTSPAPASQGQDTNGTPKA